MREELSKCKIPQLKDMLRHNDQVTSTMRLPLKVTDESYVHTTPFQLVGGTKGDLISRIIDCKLWGCLPKCPSCGGGRLKVSLQPGLLPSLLDSPSQRHHIPLPTGYLQFAHGPQWAR